MIDGKNARAIAEWVCGFSLAGAPRETQEGLAGKAKEHLLDLLGVILAGAAEEESARVAFAYAVMLGGEGSATLLRRGAKKVPAESAAFAHAVAGHSIEMDDVHNASSIHPGVATIPAALAAAEEFGRGGRELLEAIIVGYEIILRVGEAANPSKVYARNFHPTAVCGVFSSAAAAGKLMGLSAEQMVNALGLAWSFASGNMSFQAEGSWSKRLQVGNTARAGIQAARLALMGATGPAHVFCAKGFFEGYSGEFHEEKLIGGLGERLKILETGIKPFACCRYIQTPLDCLLELREREKLDPAEIERIEIDIATTGLPLVAIPAESKRVPKNTVEAQFSMYYSAAVALIAGRAGREEYRDPWLTDRRVLDLAQKVYVGSSAEVDALFPQKWPARLRIQMKDGRCIEDGSDFCLGDPEKPLGREGSQEKFRSLAMRRFSPESLRRVVGLAETMESIGLTGAIMEAAQDALID